MRLTHYDVNNIFQSTCLREARQQGLERYVRRDYFNPRAYVRHDMMRLMHSKDL